MMLVLLQLFKFSNKNFEWICRTSSANINSFGYIAPRNSITGQQFYALTNVSNNYRTAENASAKQKRSSKLFERPELFVQALVRLVEDLLNSIIFKPADC